MRLLDEAAEILAPRERLDVWQWTVGNVDWSRVPKYKAAFPGRYNADLFPFFREPLEAFSDPLIREVVCVKPAQGAGSEHLILCPLRYAVARDAKHCMYASAQEAPTKEYFSERVVLGMGVAAESADALARGSVVGQTLDAGGTKVVAVWSKGGQSFKSRPVDWVFCDEVSSWPNVGVVDEARQRQKTRPFSKLVIVSTPDDKQDRPSAEDPIWQEYEQTDKREWLMPEPACGGSFAFEFGGRASAFGVKWDQAAKRDDGTWDLQRVRDSAHYVTPAGSRIEEADRLAFVRRGRWVATNPGAPSWRRGYRYNQLLLPFEAASFGAMAVAWLSACAKGPESVRSFKFQSAVEKWSGHVVSVVDAHALSDRCGGYREGELATADTSSKVFVTVDVQLHTVWWTARQWFDGGDSRLLSCGTTSEWSVVADVARKYGAANVFVDNGYHEHQDEVFEVATGGAIKGMVLCYGRGLKEKTWEVSERYPYEGTPRESEKRKVIVVTHNADKVKTLLHRLVTGEDRAHAWQLPDGIADTHPYYPDQIASEQNVDGKWVRIRRANHLWDCEVLQLLAAMVRGVFRFADALTDSTREKYHAPGPDVRANQPAATQPQQPRPRPPARRRVSYGGGY